GPAGRGQAPAVGAEGQTDHLVAVPLKGAEDVAAVGVPQLDGLVHASRGEKPAVVLGGSPSWPWGQLRRRGMRRSSERGGRSFGRIWWRPYRRPRVQPGGTARVEVRVVV